MATRYRPYRPKVKGCSECSQRRVSCDRTKPHCMKCTSKGLECSGLDMRYRFADGVVIRGKWAGESVQSFSKRRNGLDELKNRQLNRSKDHHTGKMQTSWSNSNTADTSPTTPTLGGNLDLPDFLTPHIPIPVSHDESEEDDSPFYEEQTEVFNANLLHTASEDRNLNQDGLALDLLDTFASDSIHGAAILYRPEEHAKRHLLDGDSIVSQEVPIMAPTLFSSNLFFTYEPLPDNIPYWKRTLLSHYSGYIAGEMVGIDGRHNGWRHIILPVAHRDELVMNAVLTVSAFHISLRGTSKPKYDNDAFTLSCAPSPICPKSPEVLYDRTIQGLSQRRNLLQTNHEARKSIIVTILILLTSVMVNGRNDFPILFNMLDAVTNLVGGADQLGGSELGDFIMRQVRKMRVYAAPLISEDTGKELLSSTSHWEHLFDCLRYCTQRQPEHAVAAAHVEQLVQQARDIYMRQVLTDSLYRQTESFAEESIFHLQRYKVTLETFPPGSPGKQVLIWATFIAAADSILDEHKRFFENFLMENYNRNQFVNLLKGLAQLRQIWARRSEGDRWTHLLPLGQLLLM